MPKVRFKLNSTSKARKWSNVALSQVSRNLIETEICPSNSAHRYEITSNFLKIFSSLKDSFRQSHEYTTAQKAFYFKEKCLDSQRDGIFTDNPVAELLARINDLRLASKASGTKDFKKIACCCRKMYSVSSKKIFASKMTC